MVSRWISAMECGKSLAPNSASHSTFQSLAKIKHKAHRKLNYFHFDGTHKCRQLLPPIQPRLMNVLIFLRCYSCWFGCAAFHSPAMIPALRYLSWSSLHCCWLRSVMLVLMKRSEITLQHEGFLSYLALPISTHLGCPCMTSPRWFKLLSYLLCEFFVQSVRSSIAVHDLRRLSLSV